MMQTRPETLARIGAKPTVRIGADPDPRKFQDHPDHQPHLQDPEVRRLLEGKRGEPFVTEGYFVCRRLRLNPQYRPIPDGSSAITSLVMGENGVLYGATSGEQCHLFRYDPRPPFDAIATRPGPSGAPGISRSLVWEDDDSVIGGTSGTPDVSDGVNGDGGGVLFRATWSCSVLDMTQEWRVPSAEIEPLGVPVSGEGIAALAMDRSRGRVYGLSEQTGVFFILDLATGKVDRRDVIDPSRRFSRQLMITPDGLVVTAAVGGRIIRYDPQADRLEMLDARLPSFPGRAFYSRIESWTFDGRSGRFFIGDQAEGMLYSLDPRTLETRQLGKPSDRIGIRALAAVPDGRIFGLAGRTRDIGQMFVYEPLSGELRNLGVPLTAVEERRYGLEFGCAVAGPQGQVFFGESEWSSRLFIYFPATCSAAERILAGPSIRGGNLDYSLDGAKMRSTFILSV